MSARLNWRAVFWMTVMGAFIVLLGFAGPAHGLTRSQVRGNLKAAARHYHLSGAQTRWIVRKGVHIVFVGHTGHGESGGHVHSGHTWGCYGLFQFGPGWKHHGGFAGHHHADWRGCGKCSCYRFVKVYKVGGRSAIRRHWRATYGGN